MDVVQGIVEITVDSGGAKSMANPKEGLRENKCDEYGEEGGSNRLSDTCGRRCETGIRSGR